MRDESSVTRGIDNAIKFFDMIHVLPATRK